jgi:transcriptional regulator with GAF, ATPase, and Fis domain
MDSQFVAQPENSRTEYRNAVVRREVVTARATRSAQAGRTERGVICHSAELRAVLDQAYLVAPTNATVLMLGETGVGKEVIAETIHRASPRGSRPMIRVNCGAIPATLIEGELFGHERGAFTDAVARRIGSFEAAHGSTLFLDEVGELPLDMQVKLLRALQERTIDRLGGRHPIKVDVRVIAATNRDLKDAVARHAFREDLFYRLNVFPITIPPLRQRIGDIPALAWAFIDELAPKLGRKIDAISRESLDELQRHDWPGNVRELRNVIERALIIADSPVLRPTIDEDHPSMALLSSVRTSRVASSAADGDSQRLDALQSDHIRAVLESCGWRIRGEAGAARRLGLKPTTLESRMAKLGILRQSEVSPRTSDLVRRVNAYAARSFRGLRV